MGAEVVTSERVLTLEGLGKTFGQNVAVDGLDLHVEAGEVFGLLGPNGAGKTTTVSMAVGLLRPDRGRIDIGGQGSPLDAEVRRQIGVAPQSLAVYDELTGAENLAFFGRLQGLRSRLLKDRVDWALDFVGLTSRRKDRVATYSGGMKRRLNLAAAILHDPLLILLDEPTVGVDPQSRNFIFENILALKDKGRAIVYTTHYMEEAHRLCHRVGILDHGKLLDLDTVDVLLQRHGGKSKVYAELAEGEMQIETDDPLKTLSDLKANDRLLSFRVDRPNLESVFLHLTGRQLRD